MIDTPRKDNKGFIHLIPLVLSAVLILGVVVVGMNKNYDLRSRAKGRPTPISAGTPVLPEVSDWVNRGIAINQGSEGEWDRYLWGGFANSIIKKDGTYYLYYQGSSGYDDACGDNVYRQIGVATSTDGINWTKYSGNPVISWVDNNVVTEGAVSSGAVLGNDGNIYVYYGANTAYSGCLVHSPGRVARSNNGLDFQDLGEVIPNSLPLWGNGDEIFPVGAFINGGSWNVYYVPNGVSQTAKLGIVSGSNPTTFDLQSSRGVNNGTLGAWGPVSIIQSSAQNFAFVNENIADKPVKAYTFNSGTPASMTLAKTYIFPDCFQAAVLYEPEAARWLMLCREKAGSGFYRVKIASNPSTPPSQTSTPVPTSKVGATVQPIPTSSSKATQSEQPNPTPTSVPKTTQTLVP